MVVASKKRNWWLGQGRRKIYLYIMYLLYFLDFVQHACITYSKLQLKRRTTKKRALHLSFYFKQGISSLERVLTFEGF